MTKHLPPNRATVLTVYDIICNQIASGGTPQSILLKADVAEAGASIEQADVASSSRKLVELIVALLINYRNEYPDRAWPPSGDELIAHLQYLFGKFPNPRKTETFERKRKLLRQQDTWLGDNI